MENVVVVRFTDEKKGPLALKLLEDASAGGRIRMESAVVVQRTETGELKTLDEWDNVGPVGTVSGAMLGMLIGVLGGPVGVLVGYGAGALIGGAVDLGRVEDSDEALTVLSKAITPGSTAVIAYVEEYAVEVIDGEMKRMDGEVTRRPVDEVMTELESAEAAADAAAKEARRAIRQKKKAELHENIDERVGKLKTKLHKS